MDCFQIGALKVFADLGALIEEDERNKTKFTDLPSDIIEVVKGHVTNFKDNKDEFKRINRLNIIISTTCCSVSTVIK